MLCSNIFHALERCKAPFAGDDEAATAARNEFINQRLLPACSAAGAQGWYASRCSNAIERTLRADMQHHQPTHDDVLCAECTSVCSARLLVARRDILGVLQTLRNNADSDPALQSTCKVRVARCPCCACPSLLLSTLADRL